MYGYKKLLKQIHWLRDQIRCLKEEYELAFNCDNCPLPTGNADSPTAEDGTVIVNGNTKTIAAFEEHLQFNQAVGSSNQGTVVLSLSDQFLATIPTNELITGTYQELKVLRDNSELKPGQRYIMTDYQTEYYIDGTNSAGRLREKEITAVVSNYAVLNDNFEEDLNNGDSVTVTELPVGYTGSIQVGDVTTVNNEQSDYYFRFANGMHTIIGLKFTFAFDRYQNIAQDVIINDANNKPIVKPGGVVNTEVHDGTAYMGQSASENYPVPIERLVLTAASQDSFELEAFSDTFDGDIVTYNMDSDKVLNDNFEVIKNRKGFILRRRNELLNIDLEVDWRVVRYRRYVPNEQSRINFLNRNEDVTTRVGYNNVYLFTSRNKSQADIDSFYIMKYLEETFMNVDTNGMKKEFLCETDNIQTAIDFTIFELDSNYEPINVTRCENRGQFFNTVFQSVRGELDFKLDVENSGQMVQNTFVANPSISLPNGNTNFRNVTSLDTFTINYSKDNIFENVQMLGYTILNGFYSTELNNVILGVSNGRLPQTGGVQTNSYWHTIEGMIRCEIKDSVLGQTTVRLSLVDTKIVLSSIFFYYSPIRDTFDSTYGLNKVHITACLFNRLGMRFLANVDKLSFTNMYFEKSRPENVNGLFLYDVTSAQVLKHFKKNQYTDELYWEERDVNNALTQNILATPI